MPLFSETEIAEPEFIESAWLHLERGIAHSKDGLLLPKTLPMEQRIVLLEKLHQYAMSKNGDMTKLKPFSDFMELVCERRTDPTLDQWLWLYTQIGERHRILPLDQVIGIMSGRDALLPFLETIPDKKVWDWFSQSEDTSAEPLPYPNIEEAIQADLPKKLMLYLIMCRGVTEEQILDRALYLGKQEIIVDSMKEMSPDQCARTLIKIHTDWKDPLPLFRKVLPSKEAEIAAWHDPWGNGFFWYLYRRPVLIQELIESLPEAVLATFNRKNDYGVSPADIWVYYCPRPKF